MSEQMPPYGADPERNPKAQAKAEKAYRKAQRPFYKKKRAILPAALLALIAVIVISNSGGSKDSTNGTTTAANGPSANSTSPSAGGKGCTTKYLDQQKSDVCADAGGNVTIKGLSITATSLTPITDQLSQPALCSTVTIKNDTGKSQDYNVFDFKIQTPSGDVSSTSTLNLSSTLASGTLVTGGTKTGTVCTDNATGAKGQYVIIYKPGAFSSDRAVWLSTV